MPPIAADCATASAAPRFLNAGETALAVEFGETVDPAINDRVLALDAALLDRKRSGSPRAHAPIALRAMTSQ